MKSANNCAFGDCIALIDADGYIVEVDHNWWRLAAHSSCAILHRGLGTNYLEVCRAGRTAFGDPSTARGIEALLSGAKRRFTIGYSTGLGSKVCHFRMTMLPAAIEDVRLFVVHISHAPPAAVPRQMPKRTQVLARRLIHAQEEERQRVARELHDTAGAHLALLSLSLQRTVNQNAGNGLLTEEITNAMDHIANLSNALRNLSHSLHSPVLRYAGLSSALRALCSEFERVQGLQVNLDSPNQLPHFSDEVALCLFRVSQECLHNIVKHAGPCTVNLVLKPTGSDVRLEVSDTGRGFVVSPPATNAGLGLDSMKERVLSVNGCLNIRSKPGSGTKISVSVPLPSVTQIRSRRFPSDHPPQQRTDTAPRIDIS
jgi:signal transduction histidine kinase